MPAEEEVGTQPTVEVLDHGTGTDGIFGHFGHGHADRVKAAAQSFP